MQWTGIVHFVDLYLPQRPLLTSRRAFEWCFRIIRLEMTATRGRQKAREGDDNNTPEYDCMCHMWRTTSANYFAYNISISATGIWFQVGFIVQSLSTDSAGVTHAIRLGLSKLTVYCSGHRCTRCDRSQQSIRLICYWIRWKCVNRSSVG